MFYREFPNMARSLHHLPKSQNNNKRPNKKNDVITDLGGEGNFPMFLYTGPFSSEYLASPSDFAAHGVHPRVTHTMSNVTMGTNLLMSVVADCLRTFTTVSAYPTNRSTNQGASRSCV